MKTLLSLVVLIVFAFAVVGWFLDWYTIDIEKVKQDLSHGRQKLHQTIERSRAPAPADPNARPDRCRSPDDLARGGRA